jgi:hypothetical protein
VKNHAAESWQVKFASEISHTRRKKSLEFAATHSIKKRADGFNIPLTPTVRFFLLVGRRSPGRAAHRLTRVQVADGGIAVFGSAEHAAGAVVVG